MKQQPKVTLNKLVAQCAAIERYHDDGEVQYPAVVAVVQKAIQQAQEAILAGSAEEADALQAFIAEKNASIGLLKGTPPSIDDLTTYHQLRGILNRT